MKTDRTIRRALLVYPFTVVDGTGVYGVSVDPDGTIIKGDKIEPSLGLAYITSYFRKVHPDIDIQVFDANAEAIQWCVDNNRIDIPRLWEAAREHVARSAPDIVGISCYSIVTAASVKQMAALVKEIDPTIYTIIGGNYAQNTYDESLNEGVIDFVGFSEGEIVFANLVEAINSGGDLAAVKGIAFKGSDGAVVKTEPEPLIADLDAMPDCDRDTIDISFYSTQKHYFVYRFLDKETTRIAPILAARGCHHGCTFCTARLVWGNRLRYRDPEKVVDEMLLLRDRHGINTFNFYDANIVGSAKHFMALAEEIIRRIPGINWMSIEGMQVSTLTNPEVVEAIYRSGCKWFVLPFESGNQVSLDRVGKKHRLEDLPAVIESIRRWDDSWVSGNAITGFPWETKADIENTIDYSRRLDLDWLYVYRFIPFPGTKLYEECFDKGYVHKYSWDVQNVGKLFTLNTPAFDSSFVAERNYALNAEYNFFRNRNIELRPEQAIRDFDYVLEVAQDHAVAMFCRGRAMQQLKDYAGALEWYRKAEAALGRESEEEANAEKAGKDSTSMKSISMSFVAIRQNTRYAKYFEASGVDIGKHIGEAERLLEEERGER